MARVGLLAAALAFVVALARAAFAADTDTVVLRNGDRLKG